MSQTPNPDPVLGQPQRGPASSTTDWGQGTARSGDHAVPAGTAEAQFRAGTGGCNSVRHKI
jgi:hypothetical protein